MTHDELLAKIDKQDHAIKIGGIGSEIEVLRLMEFRNALRAVVELHSPVTVIEMNGNTRFKCEECTNWDMGITEQDLVEVPYPCTTIQAIEKELS